MREEMIFVIDQGGGKSQVKIEDNLSPTLCTTHDGSPVVVAAIEGNGQRPSHMGDGYNDGNVMFTLNATEVHGAVYESNNA